MGTLLPIDAASAPRSLILDPPMTDAELEAFCLGNDLARIERSREGVIQMNPPAGSYSSDANAEITGQLRTWWKTHRRGRVYDSSGGFYLPDGSMLSPDASSLTAERLAQVSKADRRGFPHVCPDFVIELYSETDRMPATEKKMRRWVENGACLAWLIDPYREQVDIYTPSEAVRSSNRHRVEGEGPVTGLTLDLAEVWSCYEG